jgi:hypothetical protein
MKKGRQVKQLAEVSASNYGYTESATNEPVGPRFLRITDIHDDRVNWDNVPFCKIESADLQSTLSAAASTFPKPSPAQPSPKTPRTSLSPLTICFPQSVTEQKNLAATSRTLAAETQRLTRLYEQKQAALAALKQSLLHQAFRGEL